jgi:merlin protein
LAKEKQLREDAQREKEDMERKMFELQEQVRAQQDALVN